MDESDIDDEEGNLQNMKGVIKELILEKNDLYRMAAMLPDSYWIN